VVPWVCRKGGVERERPRTGVSGQTYAEPRRAGDGYQRPLVPRSRCPPRLTPSVSAPSEAWRFLQGARPCRGRSSQPPVPSVAYG